MRSRASRVRAAARRWQLIARLSVVALSAAVGSALAVQVSGSEDDASARLTAGDDEVVAQVSDATAQRSPAVAALSSTASSSQPVAAVASESTAPDAPVVPEGPLTVTEGVLRNGDTLGAALRRQGIEPAVIHDVDRAFRPHFDFRRARAGHGYELVRADSGELVAFRYRVNPIDSFYLTRHSDGLHVEAEAATLVPRVSRLAGIVTSSLYDSVRSLGASPQIAADFADIFAWDVDFSRSVHRGDEFRILYERLYNVGPDGSEVFVRPGRILAAHYKGTSGAHTAIYFEAEEGRGGYYRPDGSSVERSFLLSPLRYGRISSTYSSARRHPILKITRPHHGIDYAAPSGTPVWSVADGTVIYRGRAGGFGNLVKVRHARGYVSYYAHLSEFAKALKVGDKVDQKQLVGYVGQTGLATGPHVCFRVAHNGHYVDPRQVRSAAGRPVPGAASQLFSGNRDALLSQLDAGPLFAVDEAL